MTAKLSKKTFLFLSFFSISFFSQASLVDRGSGMIDDVVLDVTCLQDVLHITNTYDAALDVMIGDL
jgi:hypothetical protein